MSTTETITKFLTAGNATFTLSAAGRHFTYRVQKPKERKDDPEAPLFVKVLTGPDNEASYSFAGTVFPRFTPPEVLKAKFTEEHGQPDLADEAISQGPYADGMVEVLRANFRTSPKAKVSPKAESVRWFLRFLDVLQTGSLPEALTFQHSGRCGRCGRKLTVPSSIQTGLGPECAEK